jgi:hypothetical protein
MSGYWQFYEEIARAVSFDGSGRISHKFAGVKPIPLSGNERDEQWIDSVEEVVWPLLYQWPSRTVRPLRRDDLPAGGADRSRIDERRHLLLPIL